MKVPMTLFFNFICDVDDSLYAGPLLRILHLLQDQRLGFYGKLVNSVQVSFALLVRGFIA